MTREGTRSEVTSTVKRPLAPVGGNVRPLTDPSRARRAPLAHWGGLENFLVALPRVFAARGPAARDTASHRPRSSFGDDAA